jgi:hypothetical protein
MCIGQSRTRGTHRNAGAVSSSSISTIRSISSVSTIRPIETVGQAVEIQIAVEIARERAKRAAVVIAIAIERPVQRVLHEGLDRRRSSTATSVAKNAITHWFAPLPLTDTRFTASSSTA